MSSTITDRGAARASSPIPWAIAAAGWLAAAQAFRCATPAPWVTATFVATTAGVAAVVFSTAVRRPPAARAWLYLAAGRGALAVLALDGALGLVLLARGLTRIWDPSRWIDATVVALSTGLVAAALHQADGAGGTWAQQWFLPTIPAFDLLLVLLATRSLLAVRPRAESLRLLTAGLVVQLVGDAAVHWAGAPPRLAGWTVAAATVLVAAGAVHPSVAVEPEQVRPWRKLGWVRFTVLVGALAVPLLVIITLVALDAATPSVVVLLAAGTAVLALLVLIRVRGLVDYADDLADERHRSRFEALAIHAQDATVIVDAAGAITWASPAVRAVLGPDPAAVVGRPLDALVGASTALGLGPSLAQLATLEPGATMEVHATIIDPTGHERAVEGTATNLLTDTAVAGLVLVLRDVTERAEMQRQLVSQALTDPLTGLANRALFTDRLEHALALPRLGAVHQLAVLFIDLDDFKAVNDSLGHGRGDDLLVAVGRRIADALQPSDTAARFGGDEFAVLVERVDEARALATANRILDLLAVPLLVGEYPISISASIGVAHPQSSGPDPFDLLRNADLAMYEAKREGKGTARAYRPELHEQELRQFAYRSEVGAAIERDQLHLVYQPIIDLATEQVTGAEALVRWTHPEHGQVSPLDFIPVAEATRAIIPIGRWVLRTACAQLAEWVAELGPLTMDVNVSAVQLLDPGFAADVAAILEETGVDPGLVVLELTESLLVQDADDARSVLEDLREIGVRLAIDDFGTGYSSLAYLQNFPIDIVKIDRAFVNQLGEEGRGRSLARSIIAIAGSLGIDTIAEGIETPDQAADLSALACAHGQGYHYSRPIGAEAFTAVVADLSGQPA